MIPFLLAIDAQESKKHFTSGFFVGPQLRIIWNDLLSCKVVLPEDFQKGRYPEAKT